MQLTEIKNIIRLYFESRENEKFIPGKTKIPLSVPAYSWEEVSEAVDSLLTTYVTMGKKVQAFEKLFAEYVGVNYAVMVNSGSSANLLALSILTNPTIKNRIERGQEIITPALSWATTVYPIIQVGATPVFVDVDLETCNINPDAIEKAVTNKTKAIMLVHLLGNPCHMDRIAEIAKKHGLLVIEDSCEALGAEYRGKKVGGFGDLATFSFFFSHHMTTIEGGMVSTNNEEYAELAKSLRAHGWIRELKNREEIAKKYGEIDERFLFINIGYNMRPTEIQGAFGIHQIKKLDEFIKIRRQNAKYWTKRFEKYSKYLILPQENEKHVYFGYPITVKSEAPFTKEEIVRFLEKRMVETRPVMTGNIVEHPVAKLFEYRVIGDLKNSKLIMRNSFFLGNHHRIGREEREYVADCVSEFIEKVEQR